MQPLEVVLFGGFALRRGGDTVPPIPSRAGRSLFAYLVVNRGTPQARERLVAELWPELPEGRGRRRLSHTLWQVQDALGELPGGGSYLETAADSLAFSSSAPVRVDVDAFEQGLEELRHLRADGTVRARDLGQLEQAVDLYRGAFLDGHYEPWVLAEQERLGQRYLEALSLSMALMKRFGAYEDALVYARRLTNQAPLREDAHREVMRLSMLLGRPGEAIQQYERCTEVLLDELGTAPAAATTALHERVVRQQRFGSGAPTQPPTTSSFPGRIPLVGRDGERRSALEVLESGLSGRGGGVLVEGDPGVGKSRLIEEIAEDAAWRGFAVLSTVGHATGSGGAFGAVQALLTDTLTSLRVEHLRHRVDPVWLAQVARLVPVLRRVLPSPGPVATDLEGAEGAQRMRDALVRVLVALSEVDPTLIVVDDAQWVDEGSLAVLTALAAEIADRRVAIIVGYRRDETRARPAVWEAIQTIDRALRPVRLLLGALDPFSIGELVRTVARGHQVDPGAISRLQGQTGGNPLFVVETLREVAEADGLSALASDDPSRIPLPSSIRELVLARLERLSAESRLVLEAVSVVGEGIDLSDLAGIVELPRSSVVGAVDHLVRSGFLRELDEGYDLHHDQLRRTSLDAMGESARQAMHLRCGLALEQQDPDQVERLAHHFEAAGSNRRAVQYLWAAARRAASLHAYSTADGFYRRASALQAAGPVSIVARFDLLADHEDVLDVLGERDRQGEVITELGSLAHDAGRAAEVRRRRAVLEAERGRMSAALELADRAVDAAEQLADVELQVRALQTAASVRARTGRREAAVGFLERAITLAVAPDVEAAGRTTLASILRELQRYDLAIAHLTTALEVARASGHRREEARSLGVLGSIHMETGDGARAVELYRQSLATCEAIGFRWGQALNLLNLGNALAAVGDIVERLSVYDRAAEILRSLDDRRGVAIAQLNVGYVRHALLGDDRGARSDVQAAVGYFMEVGDGPMEAVGRDTLAGIALRAGHLDRAADEVARGLRASEAEPETRVRVQLLLRRAEIHLAREAPDAARDDAGEALRMATDHGVSELLPSAYALLGRAHLAAGANDAAVTATGAAVAGLGRSAEGAHLIRLAHHDALQAAGDRPAAEEQATVAAAELRQMLDALDPQAAERAAGVAAHARLLSIAGATAPRRVSAWVAADDAPRGRRLEAVDLVEVHVELPRSGGPPDPVERRRWELAEAVDQITEQRGAPTVVDLARILEVSEATVRRDLAALREVGRSLPTRGARTG